jgi:hypothetical protein
MDLKEEERNKGFICINCGRWVPVSPYNNTVNRNHCPHCLWSKHVDKSLAGDRMASCNSGMKPIGLTIKKSRVDKWGKEIKGELMLIHECVRCRKISINKLVVGDNMEEIMNVFGLGIEMNDDQKKKLEKDSIKVLSNEDREEVKTQLFGNEGNEGVQP